MSWNESLSGRAALPAAHTDGASRSENGVDIGTRSGWGRNIVDNPKILVRQGNRWRSGITTLRPDDDVVARGRKFGLLGSKVGRP